MLAAAADGFASGELLHVDRSVEVLASLAGAAVVDIRPNLKLAVFH